MLQKYPFNVTSKDPEPRVGEFAPPRRRTPGWWILRTSRREAKSLMVALDPSACGFNASQKSLKFKVQEGLFVPPFLRCPVDFHGKKGHPFLLALPKRIGQGSNPLGNIFLGSR